MATSVSAENGITLGNSLFLHHLLCGTITVTILHILFGGWKYKASVVERPFTGDLTRYLPPGKNGGSTYFVGCNRGKKSVLINLKEPKQREVFLTMVSNADVVVENYKPGTMEKFGCGYDILKEINPKIIYTAISGFGQTGPLQTQGGLDLVIQAMSGLMSVTGERDGEPLKCGISVGDLVSGIYVAFATMIALFHRERTGEGGYADISMLDSVISIMDSGISKYCLTGELPKRIGNRHPSGALCPQVKTVNEHFRELKRDYVKLSNPPFRPIFLKQSPQRAAGR